MRRQVIAFVVGGICVLTLAGITGTMVDTTGSPAVELPQTIEVLLTLPDKTADAEGIASVTSSRATPSARTGVDGLLRWAPPVVLGLWVLGAVRTMDAGAAVLTLFTGACGIALYLIFSIERTASRTTIDISSADPSLLVVIVGAVLLCVVLITGATMLVPPTEYQSTDWKPLAFLFAAVRDVAGLTESGGDQREAGPGLDNEVYRAWWEFINHVDKSEDTSPGEAARVARASGLPPEAVEAIRETFEEVRYGDKPVTESRVERVQQAIERIDSSGAEARTAAGDALSETDGSSHQDGRG